MTDITVMGSPILVQALTDIIFDLSNERHCHLIRIDQLGPDAFDIRGHNNLSLRDVLQRQDFPKVVFDLPTTARSLYSMYGIALRGVLDLQILGTVTRRVSNGRYPHHADDLITCVRLDCAPPSASVDRWAESRSLNDPHTPLIQHSVSTRAKEYILAGVVGLPMPTSIYLRRMRNSGVQSDWKKTVAAEARERVRLAQGSFAERKDLEGVDYPLLYKDDLLERLEKLMTG